MTAWTERVTGITVGTVVAYSAAFLRSTGQYTGDAPQARGKVLSLQQVGETMLATIEWDLPDLPPRVNVKNLAVVTKDGGVLDRD